MKRRSASLLAGAVACIFALHVSSVKAATETVVYSFCSQGNCTDGEAPAAGLIDVKGTLYGTTSEGGANFNSSCAGGAGCGEVFSYDRTTGAERVVYSFCSQEKCTDGEAPAAGLIDVKGTLYGTTLQGGTYNVGTVFALDPNTGAETVVYSFGSGSDGAYPYAGLIDVKGTLYGTTLVGGTNKSGTVFALHLKSGAEAVLHSFGGVDGAYPYAGLINVSGTLYGTAAAGGANCQSSGGCGVVFSLDPTTGAEKVLYSFCSQENCTDGQFPYAGLADIEGTLYGTTFEGGGNATCKSGCGTVFSVSPATGAETVLHSFGGGLDGVYPRAGVIDVSGTLYGTTAAGGANPSCITFGPGCGTVFSVNPATGAEKVVYSFCADISSNKCRDGEAPAAGLIEVKGRLYGTTLDGGVNSPEGGTVFKIKP